MTPEEEQKKAVLEEINQVLFKDSKSLVDSTRLYYAKEFFALRMNVGPQSYTYALTPYLAKVLSQVFAAQVDNYEKEVGVIQTTVGPVLSPVQQGDLQKPDESDEAAGGSDKPKPDKPKK